MAIKQGRVEDNMKQNNNTYGKKTHLSILLVFVLVVSLIVAGCQDNSKSSGGNVSSGDNVSSNSGESSDNSASTSSSKDSVVKIAYAKGSLCLAPVHLAYELGYFDEEFEAAGIEYQMEEVDLGSMAELIAAGTINAGFGLTASLIQPIANGLAIEFTSGIHTGCTKYYVKSDSDINSVEDLKGKTIGVPSLSDSSVGNLKRKLNDVGVNVTKNDIEVEFVAYAMNDLPLALENGAVDAIGIHDPVATTAANEYNFKKILDTTTDEKFVNEYCCQSYVTSDLITNNPEGAAAYTRAIQKAAAFIQANPEEAAQIQIDAGYVTGEVEFNAELLESFNFTPSVSKGIETFRQSAIELQSFGDLSADIDLEEFIENSYEELKGVPESVIYDPDTKTFTIVEEVQ